MFRELSAESQQLVLSDSEVGSKRQEVLVNALRSLKKAEDEGRISAEERNLLKSQDISGADFDEAILEKLTRQEERTLREEYVSRLKRREPCVVCRETYNSTQHLPKILPCGHTFCLSCLEGLPAAARRCPTCRKPLTVVATTLPTNFAAFPEEGFEK